MKISYLIVCAFAFIACKSRDLHEASTSGRPEEVTRFIKAGADVNARDAKGRTPIILAASRQYPDAIKLLIEAKADVNAQDNKGETALMKAARECDASPYANWTSTDDGIRVISLLLDAKADVNTRNKHGETALMKSAERDHKGCTLLLLMSGADVSLQNDRGETALAIAESRQASDVVSALRTMNKRKLQQMARERAEYMRLEKEKEEKERLEKEEKEAKEAQEKAAEAKPADTKSQDNKPAAPGAKPTAETTAKPESGSADAKAAAPPK